MLLRCCKPSKLHYKMRIQLQTQHPYLFWMLLAALFFNWSWTVSSVGKSSFLCAQDVMKSPFFIIKHFSGNFNHWITNDALKLSCLWNGLTYWNLKLLISTFYKGLCYTNMIDNSNYVAWWVELPTFVRLMIEWMNLYLFVPCTTLCYGFKTP